jgi:hypothetical protein
MPPLGKPSTGSDPLDWENRVPDLTPSTGSDPLDYPICHSHFPSSPNHGKVRRPFELVEIGAAHLGVAES